MGSCLMGMFLQCLYAMCWEFSVLVAAVCEYERWFGNLVSHAESTGTALLGALVFLRLLSLWGRMCRGFVCVLVGVHVQSKGWGMSPDSCLVDWHGLTFSSLTSLPAKTEITAARLVFGLKHRFYIIYLSVRWQGIVALESGVRSWSWSLKMNEKLKHK